MKISRRTKSASIAALATIIILEGDLKVYPGQDHVRDGHVMHVTEMRNRQCNLSEFLEALGKIDAQGIVFKNDRILVTSQRYDPETSSGGYNTIVFVKLDEGMVGQVKSALKGKFKATADEGFYLSC